MFIIKPDVLKEYRKKITPVTTEEFQTVSGRERIIDGETGDAAVTPTPTIPIVQPPIESEIVVEKTESIRWSGEIPY